MVSYSDWWFRVSKWQGREVIRKSICEKKMRSVCITAVDCFRLTLLHCFLARKSPRMWCYKVRAVEWRDFQQIYFYKHAIFSEERTSRIRSSVWVLFGKLIEAFLWSLLSEITSPGWFIEKICGDSLRVDIIGHYNRNRKKLLFMVIEAYFVMKR